MIAQLIHPVRLLLIGFNRSLSVHFKPAWVTNVDWSSDQNIRFLLFTHLFTFNFGNMWTNCFCYIRERMFKTWLHGLFSGVLDLTAVKCSNPPQNVPNLIFWGRSFLLYAWIRIYRFIFMVRSSRTFSCAPLYNLDLIWSLYDSDLAGGDQEFSLCLGVKLEQERVSTQPWGGSCHQH